MENKFNLEIYAASKGFIFDDHFLGIIENIRQFLGLYNYNKIVDAKTDKTFWVDNSKQMLDIWAKKNKKKNKQDFFLTAYSDDESYEDYWYMQQQWIPQHEISTICWNIDLPVSMVIEQNMLYVLELILDLDFEIVTIANGSIKYKANITDEGLFSVLYPNELYSNTHEKERFGYCYEYNGMEISFQWLSFFSNRLLESLEFSNKYSSILSTKIYSINNHGILFQMESKDILTASMTNDYLSLLNNIATGKLGSWGDVCYE